MERSISHKEGEVAEPTPISGLKHPGPVDIPFGHDDVKVYIDNLFQEGQLTPVAAFQADDMPEPWMRVGASGEGGADHTERFARLFARLRESLPTDSDGHRTWIEYARLWAEWSALRWDIGDSDIGIPTGDCEELHDLIEMVFADWMRSHYPSLHNLSPFLRPGNGAPYTSTYGPPLHGNWCGGSRKRFPQETRADRCGWNGGRPVGCTPRCAS